MRLCPVVVPPLRLLVLLPLEVLLHPPPPLLHRALLQPELLLPRLLQQAPWSQPQPPVPPEPLRAHQPLQRLQTLPRPEPPRQAVPSIQHRWRTG